MRIAQVAPLFESVPPRLYGGTERVVSYLTEELVRQGHDVTLFAAGDSITRARLVAASPRSLRLDPACQDEISHHVHELETVRERLGSFDVLHFHLDYLHFPFARAQSVPHLTTVHGRLDMDETLPLFQAVQDSPLVSISDAQRAPLPGANWRGTVYHGLPDEAFSERQGPGDYLLFVGRISPEKRVDRAVEIARRAGMRLTVAAKIGAKDREYAASIQHLLHEPFVDYIGEVSQSERDRLMGGAHAVLFPIDWPEPFGLVMIEAMSSGTPVVAWRCGSAPEIVDEGVTGFVVDDLDAAVAAVRRAGRIDRARCVYRAWERFSSRRMAASYVRIYQQLVSQRGATAAA